MGQLLIGLMGALLSTTPSDAIRLRRGSSEGLILAGAAALLACGGTGLGYAVAGVAGCGFLLWVLRRTGASPWWAALVAWNPLLPAVGALAVRSAG